ncbi:MAG TPA: HAMP domain-containing sensor histidine kinase [Actinotalea sp.]
MIASLCTALMWALPGDETIPYHIAWAAFALLYGLGNWPLRQAVAGVVVDTLVSGSVLVLRAVAGDIAWQETTEIPLMSLLMALMVWHVRRRQLALATVTLMADREREQARVREKLTRITSHEMRTPLTISRGYVELLLNREDEPSKRRDLAVIDDELDRLTRVTERLQRAFRLQGGAAVTLVDVDALLQQTAERWSQVAHRRWVVDPGGDLFAASAERLRASLDTLIENAVRYTQDGATIRLAAWQGAGRVEVSVADSGTGFTPEQVAAINGVGEGLQPPRDALSQTGLGLELVRALVTSRGGRLVAGTAPEGGALLVMQLPLDGAGTREHPGGRDGRGNDPPSDDLFATDLTFVAPGDRGGVSGRA